jgi:uncharacterized protein (DUF2252 family)
VADSESSLDASSADEDVPAGPSTQAPPKDGPDLLRRASALLRGEKPGRAERYEAGAHRRADVPVDHWGDWEPAPDRPDPIALLRRQESDRITSLLPLRYQRMGVNAFTFLRGAAAVMASDLSRVPHAGIQTQACGDAHLTNFGLFAAPDRTLLFDLNDFDETLPGPFEWDVARLCASVAVAASVNGASDKSAEKAARAAARAYRHTMQQAATMSPTLIWYYRVQVSDVMSVAEGTDLARHARKAADKASLRHSDQAVRKLTEVVDGRRHFVSEPMVVIPLRPDEVPELGSSILQAYGGYLSTLHIDQRTLLSHFRFVDFAHKTVGVGSVGTRAFVMLMESGDGEPLILQLKQASASVLEEYLHPSPTDHQGERVVQGQRLLQAAGDPFLGFNAVRSEQTHHFYVRQLKDMKGSIDPGALSKAGLRRYGELCGLVLARAHGRAGDPSMIAGYLGETDGFERGMGRFARRYLATTKADHQALLASSLAAFRLT